jgi:hypothetical protein
MPTGYAQTTWPIRSTPPTPPARPTHPAAAPWNAGPHNAAGSQPDRRRDPRLASPALETHRLDEHGSFAWLAHPDEFLRRASTAIRLADGWLLADPVDAPGLDAALGDAPVVGITTLMERHRRDADAIAARHGIAPNEPLPAGIDHRRVVRFPGWHEVALWLPDRRLLVCADVFGTVGYFLADDEEPLGVHPLVRPFPPRRALRGIAPTAIAVGHGAPVTQDATAALRHALRTARRRLPAAYRHAWRMSRRPRARN